MKRRLPAERVDSLLGQLTAVQEALVHNEEAALRALDDLYSASLLGELREQGEVLEQAADMLVSEIREHVAATHAAAVFAPPRDEPLQQVDIPV